MNLFNQNYHIQMHMCKLQLVKKKKKKKQKQKYGVQEGLYNKTMGEYIKVLKFSIIDF